MSDITPLNRTKNAINEILYINDILNEHTFFTLIPCLENPAACLFRKSVTISIGFNPAFSDSV